MAQEMLPLVGVAWRPPVFEGGSWGVACVAVHSLDAGVGCFGVPWRCRTWLAAWRRRWCLAEASVVFHSLYGGLFGFRRLAEAGSPDVEGLGRLFGPWRGW